MKQATITAKPSVFRFQRGRRHPGIALLTFFLAGLSFSLSAQTPKFEKQLNALEQSFAKKDIASVRPYLSPELRMGPLPVTNTPAVLRNFFAKFQPLKYYEVLEEGDERVLVKFYFEEQKEKTSYIYFDDSGKILKIDFLDEIILEQIKTRQVLENSIKAPQPKILADKFPYEAVRFNAADGLTVTGNLYHIGTDKPVILLCHQANYNKYEYADIAPRLNNMGYNVLAIDQRSGGTLAGKTNETLEEAVNIGLRDINFLDAEQDIIAAVDYLADKYRMKVILWGSSYSSSLALLIAESHPDVKAALAFSPGNYFRDKKPTLKTVIEKLQKPVFITSSQEEAEILQQTIGQFLRGKDQVQFIPHSSGFHGSKALWEGQEGAEEYWSAVNEFLTMVR